MILPPPFYNNWFGYKEMMMRSSKLKSRKFWMAIAGVITSISVCVGVDVDPEVTAGIGAGLFGLYIVVEGIIDAISKRRG